MGKAAYNMPRFLELQSLPDLEALQAALNAIAVRHEVLRTRLAERADGTVVGTVVDAAQFAVPMRVAGVGSDEEEAAALLAEAAAPFDLGADPLIRGLVLQRGFAEGVVFAYTMHHAVGDAWSRSIFEAEISQAYEAALASKQPAWEPLPIQYGDFAAFQEEQLAGEVGQALRQWWRERLTGAPALLQLPQDRPRPAKPTFDAGTITVELPDGLLESVEGLAQRLAVNTQAMLLAALQAVLLRYSGEEEVVVGVPVAGRDYPETQGLMGYFINTLPVRCLADGSASWAELARAASRAVLEALEHSALPIDQILAASGVQRVPGANPLFQVRLPPSTLGPWFHRAAGRLALELAVEAPSHGLRWLNPSPSLACLQVLFQYIPAANAAPPTALGDIGMARSGHPVALAQAKLDLTLNLLGSTISVEFMAELFDEPTILRLVNSFVHTLQVAVADSNAPVLNSSLLNAADEQEVARSSLGPLRPDYLEGPLFHQAFAQLAEQHPGRRCLVFEGAEMSYGQVNGAADALALVLAAAGVEAGATVGVMLERSFQLLIAILGVLKAGGGWRRLLHGLSCRPLPQWLYFNCLKHSAVALPSCHMCSCLPALRPRLPR